MSARADELAEAAARRVLGHLEGERLIARFIDSYVMGFDRPQLKNPPDQFRARSNQLGREALALLGQFVVERCGREFVRFRLGPLTLRDTAAAARFAERFWPALAAQLKLGPDAAAELRARAADYADIGGRQPLFRGRIAPLLDPQPQMKEKAEHAGDKFFEALDKVAAQVATRLFTPS